MKNKQNHSDFIVKRHVETEILFHTTSTYALLKLFEYLVTYVRLGMYFF